MSASEEIYQQVYKTIFDTLKSGLYDTSNLKLMTRVILKAANDSLPFGVHAVDVTFPDEEQLTSFELVLASDNREFFDLLDDAEKNHILGADERKLIEDVISHRRYSSKEDFKAAVEEALPLRFECVDIVSTMPDESEDADFALKLVLTAQDDTKITVYALVKRKYNGHKKFKQDET